MPRPTSLALTLLTAIWPKTQEEWLFGREVAVACVADYLQRWLALRDEGVRAALAKHLPTLEHIVHQAVDINLSAMRDISPATAAVLACQELRAALAPPAPEGT